MDHASEEPAVAETMEEPSTSVSEYPRLQDTQRSPEAISTQSTQNLQSSAQHLTDQALRFLSNATNETLGACLVGLGATTYLVLGRVGLVLMGVVGGVVLHATWEGSANGPADALSRAAEEKRRKEVGLDVIHRVLKLRTRRKEFAEEEDEDAASAKLEIYSKKKLDFSGFRPETETALNEFTEAVVRDYVKWWYSPVLPSEMAFPNACRQTLVAFLLSMSGHLSRKRPADTFLDFLTNSSSIVIVFLSELSTALAASPAAACADAVQTYLESKPDSNLAHVLDSKQQEKKLDLVAQDILECYLEPKAYNCEPVREFCQQILGKLIMEMTIQSCSKPEFINGWIVYLLEEGEPELMKDIDAGLEGMASEASKAADKAVVEPTGPDTNNEPHQTPEMKHKRTISRAQEAMDDAMQEAQRLSRLIAEDDARRQREQQGAVESVSTTPVDHAEKSESVIAPKTIRSSSSISTDDTSESTTQGVATPTSSQSDTHAEDEVRSTPDGASSRQRESSDVESRPEPVASNKAPFTSFDQLVPQHPAALMSEPAKKEIPPLTLHNAIITIFDDTDPNDRSSLRQKPTADYLIQIEPASSHYPGWMIVRKYADLETLHEVLRRIAVVSGAETFVHAHATVPSFKVHTQASLRESLERYLSDAVRFRALAESEGMKRFLEKDRGLDKSPTSKGGFGWPTPTAFENMGKGMMDVLTKAPKEVAGGGKAFIGGVTGVLGNKKKNASISSTPSLSRSAISSSPAPAKIDSNVSQTSLHRQSEDSMRNTSPIIDTQPEPVPQMERKPSLKPENDPDMKPRPGAPGSASNSRPSSIRQSMEATPILGGDQILQLPPPPSDIPDDYNPITFSPPRTQNQKSESEHAARTSTSTSTTKSSMEASRPSDPEQTPSSSKQPKAKPPLTEQETQVAVELLFATINELYTLSSAWGLRRTLLTAAKTFLLRPGNPQLESIRQLLQTTVLDANTSDAGIATHLRKLRENALPTVDELKAWPPEPSPKEKEDMRLKARKLLVERGMPQALTSVMGQAASGEALGKVFDCLQVRSVARGLVFGLILQGLRAVTQ